MIRYCFCILLLFLAAGATAQHTSRTISGTITAAEDSSPLEGVSVTVKGTKTISGTQPDGIYYIPVTNKDSVLVFSHPSYLTAEIKLSESNEYNVSLHKKGEDTFTASYYYSNVTTISKYSSYQQVLQSRRKLRPVPSRVSR
jgi:hypothetical protein